MSEPLKDFEAVFPLLVDELIDVLKGYNIPHEAAEWYRKVRCANSTTSIRATFSPCIEESVTNWSLFIKV